MNIAIAGAFTYSIYTAEFINMYHNNSFNNSKWIKKICNRRSWLIKQKKYNFYHIMEVMKNVVPMSYELTTTYYKWTVNDIKIHFKMNT